MEPLFLQSWDGGEQLGMHTCPCPHPQPQQVNLWRREGKGARDPPQSRGVCGGGARTTGCSSEEAPGTRASHTCAWDEVADAAGCPLFPKHRWQGEWAPEASDGLSPAVGVPHNLLLDQGESQTWLVLAGAQSHFCATATLSRTCLVAKQIWYWALACPGLEVSAF